MKEILEAIWSHPYRMLCITADVDVIRAHYLDVYERRAPARLPSRFAERRAEYVNRFKDLQVCRLLGVIPGSLLPAFHAYSILFSRARTLEGICLTRSKRSAAWPTCPHARKRYYDRVAGAPGFALGEQTRRGERLAGRGLWAMIQPRTRREMREAKRLSACHVRKEAGRLYIRPNHLLCILCTAHVKKPLIEDNLVELRRRMWKDPEIPVTLTEGCCMVCDACNIYNPREHICYKGHVKSSLRDLMMLERLGLAPGATLSARALWRRIYDRLDSLKDVCGWGDGSNTAPYWSPCGYSRPHLQTARARQWFVSAAPGSEERTSSKTKRGHEA